MKSTFFAVAASIAAANALLDVDVDATVGHLLDLGIDINIPGGLELPHGVGPHGPPPADCTDVYHPPHHGADMDGCDNDGEGGWHWVHPGTSHPGQPSYSWTTSTMTATSISTVIHCDTTVTNCPAEGTVYTTLTVPATTTICPAMPTSTMSASSSMYYPPPPMSSSSSSASSSMYYSAPPASSSVYTVPMVTPTYTPVPPPATSVVVPPTTVAAPPTTYAPAPPATTFAPSAGNFTYPPSSSNYTSPPAFTAGAAAGQVQNVGLAAALGLVALFI